MDELHRDVLRVGAGAAIAEREEPTAVLKSPRHGVAGTRDSLSILSEKQPWLLALLEKIFRCVQPGHASVRCHPVPPGPVTKIASRRLL
jgi:hypothetical protein